MPSISTILLLAATAFAAFTSASPIASSDSVVSRETSAFVGADVGVNVGVVGVGSPHCPHGCPPIPVILAKVYAKVAVVSENLDAIIAANAIVDVDAVRPCLNDLKVILADAVVQVRALSGLSVGVVLTLGAKTLSVPEFSHILVSLLSLLCAILSLIFRCVGSAHAHVILPLIAEVGCVIAELLGAIFACVDGLLVVLVPLCGPILPVIHLLGLVDIAAVLKLNVNVAL